MYLMLWILVGVIVGWLAGKSLEGNGYGRSMGLVMGAGGAVAWRVDHSGRGLFRLWGNYLRDIRGH